jgi:two-component system sensor histidine kinase KdpD
VSLRAGLLQSRWTGICIASVATALLTAGLTPVREELGLTNIGFFYLLLTLLVASYWGAQVGLYEAVVANLAFNYFFIEPRHEFTVQEWHNALALFVFLIVSVVGGTLISMARESARNARARQAETEVALALSRAMSGYVEPREALRALCRQVIQAFAAPGAAVLTSDGHWTVLAWAGDSAATRDPSAEERIIAEQAMHEDAPVGMGSTGLARKRRIVVPGGRSGAFPARQRDVTFVPLKVGEETLGVLRLDGPLGDVPFRADPHRLLRAVAAEAALAVQRVQLAAAAAHTEALRQADELKSALMASISHDLKTPLATIKAAVSSILDRSVNWSPEDIDAFLQTIDSQSDRLNRVISDILDLNRIESGVLTPDQLPVNLRHLLRAPATLRRTKPAAVTLSSKPRRIWMYSPMNPCSCRP